MPCGLMNESSFGFLNEGVITKGLTEWKSHMYAMWPKQWKLLRREENRFLAASTHLYKRVCPLVGRSVNPSISRFFKSRKLANLTNLTDLNLKI